MKEKIADKWDEYFMEIARVVSKRTSCFSEPKGAVIVIDNKFIVSTGYNGAPMGITSCKEIGYCLKKSMGYGHGEGHHICLANHAEENALIIAARLGHTTNGAKLYCTHKPCFQCTKSIINSGIKEVIYFKEYNSDKTDILLASANIELYKVKFL